MFMTHHNSLRAGTKSLSCTKNLKPWDGSNPHQKNPCYYVNLRVLGLLWGFHKLVNKANFCQLWKRPSCGTQSNGGSRYRYTCLLTSCRTHAGRGQRTRQLHGVLCCIRLGLLHTIPVSQDSGFNKRWQVHIHVHLAPSAPAFQVNSPGCCIRYFHQVNVACTFVLNLHQVEVHM